MSLLDRFRQGSELNSVGHFTLDEKRARNKMARFQLVRQHDFLLLIAQAAIAAGCKSIEIEADLKQIVVRAAEAALEPDKLSRLEDYLFDTRAESISYYLLGVARNAVTPFCKEEPSMELEEGALVFKARPLQSYPDLNQHLKDYLLYSPCNVSFNGRNLPRIPLEEARMIALHEHDFSVLTLIRHGVLVGRKYVESEVKFQAVISEPGFTVDASFFDVVEDDLYLEALSWARTRALQLVAEKAAGYNHGDPGRMELLELLCRALPDPAGRALRECPLFVMADREEVASYKELVQAKGLTGSLLYSRTLLNLQLKTPVVLIDCEPVLSSLNKLLPGALKDATNEYRQMQERLRHINLWNNSPRPTELPPSSYLIKDKVEGPDWQAEIGYLGVPGESHVIMLYQGKLLCSERLEGLPPGATAVINFDEVEINESWTRPFGRRFRSIMKTLETYLENLFERVEVTPEQIYPALREHILSLFMKRQQALPPVAAKLPLFNTVKGELLSFEQVHKLPTIAIGQRHDLSDNIPGHLLPARMLLYSYEQMELLTARLGGKVEDFRVYQLHLVELDRKLLSPREPKLDTAVDLAASLEKDDLKGEIGLSFAHPGPKVCLTIYFRGATMEVVEVNMTKLMRGHAAVQLDRLRPNDRWTGIERDKTYRLMIEWLKERFRELEESALHNENLPANRFLSLLQVYSGSIKDFPDRKVFDSTFPGRLHSLNELKKELETHGELLRGPVGVTIPGRIVLNEQSKDRGFREGQLLDNLGQFRWGDASEMAKRLELVQGFQARRVHEVIRVAAGSSKVRLPVESCRGEVTVGLGEQGRFVDCYYGGRFVCKKPDVLPLGCAAAIDSEALELSEDFKDAKIPPALLEELLQLCEKGLLSCATDSNREVRKRAIQYAQSGAASEAFLKALHELPIFLLQGGGSTSLKELESKEENVAYVHLGFPSHIKPDRLVLRADSEDTALIRARTKFTPYKFESYLERLEEDRLYLASLPRHIPERLNFRRTYVLDERLTAELALFPMEASFLGFDENGMPLGYLEIKDVLPVWGMVSPARAGKRDKKKNPTAELTLTEERWLRDRIGEIFAEWVEELAHREWTEKDKDRACGLLTLTKHELGSSSDHHQAFLAQKLWSLPLFPCVDGTRVSGESLALRLASQEGPLEVASERWRAPGHLPLLTPESAEHRLLRSILGKECLQWYEAPPLVDTEKLKSKVGKIVAWGFSPLAMVQRKLGAIAESLEEAARARAEAKPKPEPESKPEPEKPKKPKVVPPEEIFLEQMKNEAKAMLGFTAYQGSDRFFATTQIGSWILGPPVYVREKLCYLNSSHSGVRWLIHLDPKAADKHYRAARVLLLVHWVDLVNVASDQLTDDQERQFLTSLAERMIQTFS